MINNKKIIFSIFAGTKSNLEILFYYVNQIDIIDEIHIWNFTRNINDEVWLRELFDIYRTPDNEIYYDTKVKINKHINFKVKAKNDAHLLLTYDNGEEYEIVLGAYNNTKSIIRKGKQGISLMESKSFLLEKDDWNEYTLNINDDGFEFINKSNNKLSHKYDINKKIVKISVMTGWSSEGLWLFDENNKKYKLMELKNKKSWKEYYIHYHMHVTNIYNDIILIKSDEDIVYMDIKNFNNFLNYRIDNPNHFFISACVINNDYSGKLLQKNNIIPLDIHDFVYNEHSARGTIHTSGDDGIKLHTYFINNMDKFNCTDNLVLYKARHNINFICFLSRQISYFNECEHDDEHYISVVIPNKYNFSTAVYGNFLVSHLSFGPQKNSRDYSNIYKLYKNLITK